MLVPLVDLKAQDQSIKDEIDAALDRVVASSRFILGEEVAAFEAEFAAFCGAKHCVGVSSGTAALHLALAACGIGPGDEVITTPFTFTATAEAIEHVGAQVVFADIALGSYNIDPHQVRARVTEKTRAILPVHLYGQPANMTEIMSIAGEHGLKVVEDAAQAHGAEWMGAKAGAIGDVGCFSFYPAKNLGAYGDAGAVVTNDAEVAARVRLLRDHGRRGKYEHLVVGYNHRLDALQAAVLRVKLRKLSQWNEQRRQIASMYKALLDKDKLVLPGETPGSVPVYHLFVVRADKREQLRAKLSECGIETGIHYPIALHLQPAFADLGHQQGAFPQAESAAREVLSLPMYPEMTAEQVEYVATAVNKSLLEERQEARERQR